MKDSQRFFEIIAAACTGIAKLIFVDLFDIKPVFVISAIFFWGTYIYIQSKKDAGLLQYWGFRKDNFKSQFLLLLPYALGCVVLFIGYAIYKSHPILNWHIIPVFLLYPIWGIIQQLLVVGLVAGNLKDQKKYTIPKYVIVFCTALLFGAIHYPSKMLMLATFLMAIVYTILYLKEKNIWVLGIYHGSLGALFYFLVLGKDPILEIIEKL